MTQLCALRFSMSCHFIYHIINEYTIRSSWLFWRVFVAWKLYALCLYLIEFSMPRTGRVYLLVQVLCVCSSWNEKSVQ